MFRHVGRKFIRTGTATIGSQKISYRSAIRCFFQRSLESCISHNLIIKFFSTHF